jgi:hypothetical protein
MIKLGYVVFSILLIFTLPYFLILFRGSFWIQQNDDRMLFYLIFWFVLSIIFIIRYFLLVVRRTYKGRVAALIISITSFFMVSYISGPLLFYYSKTISNLHSQVQTEEYFSIVFAHQVETKELEGLINIYDPDFIFTYADTIELTDLYSDIFECYGEGTKGLYVFQRTPCSKGAGPYVTSLGEIGEAGVVKFILKTAAADRVPIYIFNALPELNDEYFYLNHLAQRRLSTILKHEKSAIFFANLNSTAWSDPYRRFTQGSQLLDAFWGFGYPSCANSLLGRLFCKDHVFYRGQLRVKEVKRIKALSGQQSHIYLKFKVGGDFIVFN